MNTAANIARPSPAAEPSRVTKSTALRPTTALSLRISPAFSAQSVRQGAILGLYGRAEVETLAAIAKNPSRVAAYSRIVEGKHHNQRDHAEVRRCEVDCFWLRTPQAVALLFRQLRSVSFDERGKLT